METPNSQRPRAGRSFYVTRLLWWIGAALPLAASGVSIARTSSTLYAVDTDCRCLFSVDLSSGVTVEIGQVSPDVFLTNMAVDLDETIYVLDNQGYYLLTIDPETAEATLLAAVGELSHGLAIAPVPVPAPSGVLPAGTLFATSLVPAEPDELIIIDKRSGSTTVIDHLNTYYYGLDFRADGVLFGAGDPAPYSEDVWQLLTIDTATGEETLIGTLPIPGPNPYVGALVFTPDGQLLMSGSSAGQDVIWEVDQNTAALSNPVTLSGNCCGFPQGLGFVAAPPIAVHPVSWGRIKGAYK